ncbi:DUF6456 domain-containing protein [Thermaurantiacus tibetensis]|uniref:DUF6456 domain-containing protein n=1 Tax=Thermaurantiacus tibetensis TaxID=2759035 RepID=UPI0038B65EAF
MIDAKAYPNRTIGRRRLAPADAIDRQLVAVNLDESPLSWLHRRKFIDDRQLAAGERLRRDHHLARLDARVTMRWDLAAPADSAAPRGADAQILGSLAARARFHAAMEAVGPGLADILWRVVCAGEGLEPAEKGLGWPVRSGKLVLGMALERLARHYENHSGSFSA